MKGLRRIVERRGADSEPITEATVKIEVDGQERLMVAEGDGPVHALAGALRKALLEFYPEKIFVLAGDGRTRGGYVFAGHDGRKAASRSRHGARDGAGLVVEQKLFAV